IFEGQSASQNSCALTSVKANIGHLEAAAGVINVITAILALQNERIPPQLHFHQINSQASLAQTNLFIPTTLEPWPRNGRARIAGVSAFSISGTNTHVILEEASQPAPHETLPDDLPHLLTLSAQNELALRELAMRMKHYLSNTTANLADICYTANT